MTPLHAVTLAAAGRETPSIEELAARPDVALPVIIAPGGGGHACVQRVAECLHLGGIALLLFQDPSDAVAFETRLAEVQARVTGVKNLVLCCDGTANEFAQDRTNVIKLFYALEHSTPQQVAFYQPGLGTMELPGALTGFAKRVTRLLGKAVGYGLEADVRDAYVFLMNNFERADRVFLFGFSRGAYTVRVVASLLHMYGLLPKGNEPLVPYAIRMLTATGNERFSLAHQFRDTFSIPCKPWFVGVWDTVSSVGWVDHPLKVPFTANNPDIENGRQAISIDEHRAFFRQNL